MVESLLFIVDGVGAGEKKPELEPVKNGPALQHCLHLNKTNLLHRFLFILYSMTPFIFPIALYNLQQLKEELCVLYLSSATGTKNNLSSL